MRIETIDPGVPFLEVLARDWLREAGADPLCCGRGLILLPTRRAARALAETFLRVTAGRALLLPRIAALGAADEAPLALVFGLALPPAVSPQRRFAILARLILAMSGQFGVPRTLDRAWKLATALAELMDEAELAEIDLAAALPGAAPERYAEHWQQNLKFLEIITQTWPSWLAEAGLMNPLARRVALLNAQAAHWEREPPEGPVWIAGTTGGIPAVARLLAVVARLPRGRVLLPGLDQTMAPETWSALPDSHDSHPQAGFARLLARLGLERSAISLHPARATPALATRAGLISRALLPAPALGAWAEEFPVTTEGLWRLRPADQQEEAVAIALILRHALQTPSRRAALVTPDRELAARVTAELGRFGVIADDSAGEKLAETPPAVFLRLVGEAVAADLAPVPLLALLKHPLAAAGLSPRRCRALARRLELDALRGPRPPPGLTGLRLAARNAEVAVPELVERLAAALLGLLRRTSPTTPPERSVPAAPPAELLAALIEAAEALATTDTESGTQRLWAGEEGEALAGEIAALLAALADLPPMAPAELPGLLAAALETAPAVRSRRALRGREGVEHPRLFIWGLLEARLQHVDCLVLGSLLEGIWPAAAEPGPWLNRPMRAAIGLAAAEERIGQEAHDFVSLASAAEEVVLSAPRRRNRAPAVPARWLVRLEAMLAARNTALPQHPAVAWARALDQPEGVPKPAPPPQPRPPLRVRPRQFWVTEIATWRGDPYAIYARHVLGLEQLPPLEEVADLPTFGTLVHRAIGTFLAEAARGWPADAPARLAAILERDLQASGQRSALLAWWRPRLARIAYWVAEEETRRRNANPPRAVFPEIKGAWPLCGPAGAFELTGRADRIELCADGTLSILDYKTGTVPNKDAVADGLEPQLLLEAGMAEAGCFDAIPAGRVGELVYWKLSGGKQPGAAIRLFDGEPDRLAETIATAQASLIRLISHFDDPDTPYGCRPDRRLAPRRFDGGRPSYAQLARLAEWAEAGEEE